MAFIRDYAARDQGDPFKLRLPKRLRGRLRVPKKLRKMQLGHVLKQAAQLGAGFIPGGVGAIAQQLIPDAAAPVAAEAAALPADDEIMAYGDGEFARSYGWEAGDALKKTPKRKAAASGPKQKAAAKATKRQAKATGTQQKLKGSSARGNTGKPSVDWARVGSVAGKLGNVALAAGRDIPGIGGALGGIGSEFGFAGFGKGARGGHRRSMNPANVHALRRSLRRVEGFEKLVKRIEKQYPRLKRAVGHAPVARAKGGKCR